jgi:pimeloyl-ACP methyl ester carboxylesterase
METRKRALGESKMTSKRSTLLTGFCIVSTLFVILTASSSARSGDRVNAAGASPQANQNIEGFWQGTLDAGAVKLRLLMKFLRNAEGKLVGLLDSLDQGANDIPMNIVTFEGGSLHVEMKSLQASYDGKLNADRNEITGEFTQGSKLPLNLKRVAKASDAALVRPQNPVKPYPYEEVEVTYSNEQDKIKLSATLTVPKGAGPFPAVVLITGSGSQNRDEMLLGHRPFLVLADYLTRRGIAVLRADDRGMGGTSRGAAGDTSENYAADALAGVAFLKTRKEINPKQIGLVGHSEGGMIAPMAAVRSRDVAFVVLMAGPGIVGDKLLLMQNGLIGAAECQKQVKESVARTAGLFAIAKNESDPQAAQKKMDTEQAKIADAARKSLEAQLNAGAAQLKGLVTPWFRFFLNYDPRPTLMKVRVPVLAINGSTDTQVPATEDLAAIDHALKDGGNRDYKIVLLPNLNHLFQTSSTGAPSEYGEIEETIAPIALQTIGDWIVAHASRQ